MYILSVQYSRAVVSVFLFGGKANLVLLTLFYSTLLALTHRQKDGWRNEYTRFAWAGGTCPHFAWAGGLFFQLCCCVVSVISSGRKCGNSLSGGCAIIITTGTKKSSSRLSGGCAIVITTGKKKFQSSVWRVSDRYYDQKKKVLVVCLAGAGSLL